MSDNLFPIRGLLTFAPITAATIAVVFEMGFFSYIGPNFFYILTLFDHFMAAVAVLPWVLFIWAAVAVLTLIFNSPNNDNGQVAEGLTQKPMVAWVGVLVFAVLFCFVASYNILTLVISLVGNGTALVLLWERIQVHQGKRKGLLSKRHSLALVAVFLGPVYIFILGYSHAAGRVEAETKSQITLCSQVQNCTSFPLIKAYQNGALIKKSTTIEYRDYSGDLVLSYPIPTYQHLFLSKPIGS